MSGRDAASGGGAFDDEELDELQDLMETRLSQGSHGGNAADSLDDATDAAVESVVEAVEELVDRARSDQTDVKTKRVAGRIDAEDAGRAVQAMWVGHLLGLLEAEEHDYPISVAQLSRNSQRNGTYWRLRCRGSE